MLVKIVILAIIVLAVAWALAAVAVLIIGRTLEFRRNRPARLWRRKAAGELSPDWTHEDCYRWLVRNGFEAAHRVTVTRVGGESYEATSGWKSLTDRPVGCGDSCVHLEFRHAQDGRVLGVRGRVMGLTIEDTPPPPS